MMISIVKFYASIFLCFIAVKADTSAENAVFFADDGLEKTIAFPLNEDDEKPEFQNSILQLLGLKRPPKPRKLKDESASLYMLDLYRTSHHEEFEDEDELGQLTPAYRYLEHSQNQFGSFAYSDMFDHKLADDIIGFVDQEQRDSTGTRKSHEIQDSKPHMDHLSFDVSDVEAEARLIGAELRFYANGTLPVEGRNGVLNVYLALPRKENGEANVRKIASTEVGSKQRTWMVLNVTEAVDHWTLHPMENAGILAEIVEEAGVRKSPFRDYGVSHGFIVGFFNAGNEHAHRRIKRSATSPNDRERRRKKRDSHPFDFNEGRISRRVCQKRTLYVSFRDLGWQGWIIAPDGFAAYYCQGECSFPLQAAMNATNHAIVQTLVNLMDPMRAPQAKCAPSKLGPLKLLYFDDTSNVVLKKYNNMVVRSCGCH